MATAFTPWPAAPGSLVDRLITQSETLIALVKSGVHPSMTQQVITELQEQNNLNREVIHHTDGLISAATDQGIAEDTDIRKRLHSDRLLLAKPHRNIQAAISHLQGHDWGIFAK